MELPKVIIVILNWNGKDDILECLRSVRDITYQNREVAVVDNGSTDGSQEAIRAQFPEVTLIENDRNLGFSAGNNVGIRYALNKGPDYILLLNNDTTVNFDFLNELVEVAEEDRRIGAVGSKLYLYADPTEPQFQTHKDIRTPQEADFLSGAALLVKARIFREVGLLDETFYPAYAEDTDFCLRIRRNSYKLILAPDSKVFHKGSNSTNRFCGLQIYLKTKYRFVIVRRYRIGGSCLGTVKYLFTLMFDDLKQALSQVKRIRSPKPVLMLILGLIEGLYLFFKNPKERW